jgi:hypothetical protein
MPGPLAWRGMPCGLAIHRAIAISTEKAEAHLAEGGTDQASLCGVLYFAALRSTTPERRRRRAQDAGEHQAHGTA